MGVFKELVAHVLLFFLVFGMSATVDIGQMRKQMRNKAALLIGVSLQFIIIPFVGFLIVKILNLSMPMGVTLLVVTSSPGGSYSNWWCSLFNAELALSVTMTGLSTFLSVIFLPLNLVIYASTSYSSEVVDSLDWAGLILSLVVVLGGIASGIFMSYLRNSTRFNLLANKVGNLAGIGLVVFSFLVTSSSKDASLWGQDFTFYFAVALPAVLGVAIATVLAAKYDLEKPERVAVAVEACYQNTGIATSVAFTMFDGDELATAVGVPLFYGICEMVILAVYCIVCWKLGWTKAPADENIFKVIAKSYEVEKASLNSPNAIEVVNGQVFTSTTEGYKVDEESLRESSNAETKPEGSDANGKHQRIPADDKELI